MGQTAAPLSATSGRMWISAGEFFYLWETPHCGTGVPDDPVCTEREEALCYPAQETTASLRLIICVEALLMPCITFPRSLLCLCGPALSPFFHTSKPPRVQNSSRNLLRSDVSSHILRLEPVVLFACQRNIQNTVKDDGWLASWNSFLTPSWCVFPQHSPQEFKRNTDSSPRATFSSKDGRF